jgi:hypothetical protein
VSTYYLLPSLSFLGDHLADSLGPCFPGLNWSVAQRQQLAEILVESIDGQADALILFREELPTGVAVEQALVAGFGASVGDEVVEVRAGTVARRWRISGLCSPFA